MHASSVAFWLQLFFLSTMSRARNTASSHEVAKALRAELPNGLTESQYLTTDMDAVCDNYKEAMVSILQKTSRPLKELLVKAAKEAFPKSAPGVAEVFGYTLYQAFQHCKIKCKSMSSGSKSSIGVKHVCKALKNQAPKAPADTTKPTLGQQLRCKARVLHREHSSPKKERPAVLPLQSSSSTLSQNREDVFSLYFGNSKRPVVEVSSEEETPLLGAAAPLQFLDSSKGVLVRMDSAGNRTEATMSAGADGFCEARFANDPVPVVTEMPNLLLEEFKAGVKKRPAGNSRAAAKKKFAKALEKEPEDVVSDQEETEAESAEPPAPDAVQVNYSTPYRYPNGSWALRRRFSNGDIKQILSLKRGYLNDAAAKKLVEAAREKLLKGESEKAVKGWLNKN